MILLWSPVCPILQLAGHLPWGNLQTGNQSADGMEDWRRVNWRNVFKLTDPGRYRQEAPFLHIMYCILIWVLPEAKKQTSYLGINHVGRLGASTHQTLRCVHDHQDHQNGCSWNEHSIVVLHVASNARQGIGVYLPIDTSSSTVNQCRDSCNKMSKTTQPGYCSNWTIQPGWC